MNVLRRRFQEIKEYPSAIVGLTLILLLVVMSIFAVIHIPYSEAIRLWRGGEGVWTDTPRNARPVWMNYFSRVNLPENISVDSRELPESTTKKPISDAMAEVEIVLPFNFPYDDFPKEITLFFTVKHPGLAPHVTILWRAPDGREIELSDQAVRSSGSYRISQDASLQRRLRREVPHVALFQDPTKEDLVPLNGDYELVVRGFFFSDDTELDVRLIVYGQLYGMAGTDHRRRDLTVALLWGAPIALAFGILATVGTTVTTLIIAATGVWFGKTIDAAIQRITEVNMIIPQLPVMIMVGTFYSRSIWTMLVVLIALNIFSGGIKTYRAMLLQIKESPYIEAAKAYGAGNFRIIFRYLIPRIIPTLIPGFVTAIPFFVFYEASLAVLGLGDPILPTWGKVLDNALKQGALYMGHYYWVLQPAVLLMVTGLGFAMLGFALDRIFNPRLRGL